MFELCALVSWEGNSHAKVPRGYLSGIKGSSTSVNQRRGVEGQKCQLLPDTGSQTGSTAVPPVEGKSAIFIDLNRQSDLDNHFSWDKRASAQCWAGPLKTI
jgi:hypothetical protein